MDGRKAQAKRNKQPHGEGAEDEYEILPEKGCKKADPLLRKEERCEKEGCEKRCHVVKNDTYMPKKICAQMGGEATHTVLLSCGRTRVHLEYKLYYTIFFPYLQVHLTASEKPLRGARKNGGGGLTYASFFDIMNIR